MLLSYATIREAVVGHDSSLLLFSSFLAPSNTAHTNMHKKYVIYKMQLIHLSLGIGPVSGENKRDWCISNRDSLHFAPGWMTTSATDPGPADSF